MGEVYEKALKRKDASGATGGAEQDGDGKAPQGGKGKAKKAVPAARGSTSTGKIVSLMGGNVNKVASPLMSLSSIFGAPFELVIAITFLYQILGWTCLVSLGIMALTLPINHILVKRRLRNHRKMLASCDTHMEILDELFQAIRLIKYSADEESWVSRVFEARKTELDWLLKTRMNNLGINALWNFSPDLVMIVSIACFTLVSHQQLTVPITFTTALALFGMVRSPMTMLPTSLTQLLQTWVSIQRLKQFFDDPEVDPWVLSLRPGTLALPAPDGAKGEVGISHGTFKYHEKDAAGSSSAAAAGTATAVEGEQKFELSDVDVSFPEGKLSLVCGARGRARHSSSYSSANIRFGLPFEEERYKEVVEACALQANLDMFDTGDETEIGEAGISLSGRQKACVALALAVYSRAKTVLLDNPLSAVDSQTARHLFRRCLRGLLLENRTVILITHHISLCLSSAHYVVRLSEGRITLQGHVDELNKGKLITELVKEDDTAGEADAADVAEKQVVSGGKVDAKDPHERSGKLIEEEKRATGCVKWSVYNLYLHSAGYWTWAFMVALLFLGRVARVAHRTYSRW